jgi:tetratricopeptide (TPR) repeat protein
METLVSLAILSDLKGDLEDALVHLDKCLAISIRYPFAHHIKGSVLFGLGRYGEAADSYRSEYKLRQNISAYEGLVKCYIKLERFPEALSTAKESITVLPKSARAYCLIGMVMAETGNNQKVFIL